MNNGNVRHSYELPVYYSDELIAISNWGGVHLEQ
jgi:hypothetical protein